MFNERIQVLILCLFLLVNILAISNAAISIFTVLAAIQAVYLIYNKKVSVDLPKSLLWTFLVFALGLFVASICINDFKSLTACKKNIFWIMNFFIAYVLTRNIGTGINVSLNITSNIALFIMSVVGVYDFVIKGGRVASLFDHPNTFGMILELIIPFTTMFLILSFKYNKYKFLAISNVILGCFSLYLSGSRGAILGVVVGMLAILIFRKIPRIGFCATVIVLVLVGCLGIIGPTALKGSSLSRGYDNERVLLAKSTYNMWLDHKVVGVGLTNWTKEYKEKYISPYAKEPNLPFAHNVYLQYLATTGILGGVTFIFLLLTILYYLWDNINIASTTSLAMLWVAIAVNAHGFFDGGLAVRYSARVYFILLGMAVACIVYNKKVKSTVK